MGVAVRQAGEPGRHEAGRQERVVIPFLVVQRRDVEEALVGQIERELQAGDEVLFRRRQELVLRLHIGADLERDVVQRADRECLGVEDLVPAEGAANQTVEFRSARAGIRHADGRKTRRCGVAAVGFQQIEIDEVGAVGPDVEMGERQNLFRGLVRCAGSCGRELIGVGQAVVVDEKERKVWHRLGLDRHGGEIGGKRGSCGGDREPYGKRD